MASNARSRIESQHFTAHHSTPTLLLAPFLHSCLAQNRTEGRARGVGLALDWTGLRRGRGKGARVRGEATQQTANGRHENSTPHLQGTRRRTTRIQRQTRRGCRRGHGSEDRQQAASGRATGGCARLLCVCPLTVICPCCHWYRRSVRFIRVDIAPDGNRSVAKEGATAATATAATAPADACTQLGGHGARTSQCLFTHPARVRRGVRKRFLWLRLLALRRQQQSQRDRKGAKTRAKNCTSRANQKAGRGENRGTK
jgi:hypothetical protein